MSNQANTRGARQPKPLLPFFVEFVKFSTGFAAIVAVGLLALRFAGALM